MASLGHNELTLVMLKNIEHKILCPSFLSFPSVEKDKQLKRAAAVILTYCQTSNINCTLVGKKICDHSDVVGAAPTGDDPTKSSFST